MGYFAPSQESTYKIEPTTALTYDNLPSVALNGQERCLVVPFNAISNSRTSSYAYE